MSRFLTILWLFIFLDLAFAHDTWLQTNTNLIRVGDAVHIDLMLGNHGNEHRDFKLASKVDPASGSTVLTVSVTTFRIASSIWATRPKKDFIRQNSPSPNRGSTLRPIPATASSITASPPVRSAAPKLL